MDDCGIRPATRRITQCLFDVATTGIRAFTPS
ncbi:Uncharacterised protein [Vibrio cholerae]|nr:Uncharacterised protein [Vibrio cholerae]